MPPSGDIGVLTTDVSLVIQSWDDWLASATSIAADQARGRPLTELIPAIEERRLLDRFREVLATGTVQVFTSALNGPLIPCAPRVRSHHFEQMQQRVTVGPLLHGERIAGVVVTVQDVTTQLDAERDLAASLLSGDVDEQRAATDAIAAGPRIESLDSFSPALRSSDWRIRRAAVTALASAADQELLRAVLRTLKREHRDFSTLSSALKLLTLTDEDITEPLIELLRDPDVDLRIQAALALGDQQHPAAVVPLLAALDDPDANVRFHAIEALGRLRASEGVEPLIAIAESGDFFLGFAALDALASIDERSVAPRIVPLLQHEAFRDPAICALSVLGDERVIPPLVAALNASADSAPAVAQALASIADRLAREALDVSAFVRAVVNERGRAHLLDAAHTADVDAARAVARVWRWIGGSDGAAALDQLLGKPEIRAEVAAALVDVGEPAVNVLVERLDDEDDDVRALAAASLGQIGSPRATRRLVALLEDPRLAITACGALARIADRDAFEPLLRLLDRRDPAIRMAAVSALNALGHPQTQERIVTLLDAPDPLVRESAVRIAGYFGYATATERVRALASDPSEPVRIAALEHLPFFDEDLAVQALASAIGDEAPRTRAAAVRALARLDTPAVLPLLDRALTDADNWVRYFAARAIGERPDSSDFQGLLALVEGDPSPPVRAAAIEAIGLRRFPVSAEPLLCAASEPNTDVSGAALLALGRLGGPEAIPALRGACRTPEPDRRKAAALGLGAVGSPDAVAELEWMAAADADLAVAECAVAQLGEIASRSAESATAAIDALIALLAEPARWGAAISALGRLPVDRLPHLAVGLQHPQPPVRRRTVEALARYRHPVATRLMAPAFEDTDAGVREAAASAVQRLGTRTYDDVLRRLAGEDPSKSVRRMAAAALPAGRMTD